MINQGFLQAAKLGIAHAKRALEELAPGELSMDVLWAGSVPTPRLGEVSGDPEDLVVGAYVVVTGDAPGRALLIFQKESALKLADLLLGQPVGTATDFGEMEISVLQEVANILTSSYLTAIGDHYNITLLPEPPLTAMDMAAAVVDSVLTNSGHFEPETLSIVTRFRSITGTLDGFFLYIPEAASIIGRKAA